MAGRGIKHVVLVSHFCNFTDLAGNARFLKAALEFFKFSNGCVFKKIHDRHMGMIHPAFVSTVDVQEGLNP